MSIEVRSVGSDVASAVAFGAMLAAIIAAMAFMASVIAVVHPKGMGL